MTEMNEIHELSKDELDTVFGGEVSLKIVVTSPKTMTELHQGWADLGKILKSYSDRY